MLKKRIVAAVAAAALFLSLLCPVYSTKIYATEIVDSPSANDAVSGTDAEDIAVSAADISVSDVPLSPWECEPAQCLAALLVDDNTQTVLYEKKAHERIFPASTTKILTALLVIEAIERGDIHLEDEITADAQILNSVIWDASHVSPRIKIDEKLTVENYLYCVMIESDCVVCNILGRYVAGSIDDFVVRMNARAAELGCEDTQFRNTHGYPDDEHYTTAWSLYLIAREAMKHELFRKIVSTNEYTVPATNKYKERKLKNSNWLLGMPARPAVKYDADYSYENCIGIKTGYSSQAGSCLVSCAEKDGRTEFCIVLGAWALKLEDGSTRRRSFSESKRLLEWGFKNFDEHICIKSGTIVGECPVTGGGYKDSAKLAVLSDASAFLPKGVDYSSLDMNIELYQHELQAPVMRGTRAGKLTLSHEGKPIAEVELISADRINPPTELERLMIKLNGLDRNEAQRNLNIAFTALNLFIMFIVICARAARKKREEKENRLRKKKYEYESRYRR